MPASVFHCICNDWDQCGVFFLVTGHVPDLYLEHVWVNCSSERFTLDQAPFWSVRVIVVKPVWCLYRNQAGCDVSARLPGGQKPTTAVTSSCALWAGVLNVHWLHLTDKPYCVFCFLCVCVGADPGGVDLKPDNKQVGQRKLTVTGSPRFWQLLLRQAEVCVSESAAWGLLVALIDYLLIFIYLSSHIRHQARWVSNQMGVSEPFSFCGGMSIEATADLVCQWLFAFVFKAHLRFVHALPVLLERTIKWAS